MNISGSFNFVALILDCLSLHSCMAIRIFSVLTCNNYTQLKTNPEEGIEKICNVLDLDLRGTLYKCRQNYGLFISKILKIFLSLSKGILG
jgi:hypothetical protein